MTIATARTLDQYTAAAGRGARASEYAIYTRSESGVLTRTGRRIRLGEDTTGQYAHEERLAGWPERRVFWTREHGESVGAAPINF